MRWTFEWLGYPPSDQPGWTDRREGFLAETAGDYPAAIEYHRRALEALPEDEATAQRVEWLDQLVAVDRQPVTVPIDRLRSYAGRYGPRRIELDGDQLRYQREGREPYRLIALTDDTFALEGLVDFRIRVVTDGDGRPVKLVGLYIGGEDESPRDPPNAEAPSNR